MSKTYETGSGRLTQVGYYTPGRVFVRDTNRAYVRKSRGTGTVPESGAAPPATSRLRQLSLLGVG